MGQFAWFLFVAAGYDVLSVLIVWTSSPARPRVVGENVPSCTCPHETTYAPGSATAPRPNYEQAYGRKGEER